MFGDVAGGTTADHQILGQVQLDRAISISDFNSEIVAFNDDGQFIGSYGAFTTAAS